MQENKKVQEVSANISKGITWLFNWLATEPATGCCNKQWADCSRRGGRQTIDLAAGDSREWLC